MTNGKQNRVKFGYETYFQSCTVGCDDREVIYIRTTGLDGPVQLVRIKPSELEGVILHLQSRLTNPHQGNHPRVRKEFVPLSERVGNPYVDEDEEEVEQEAPPVALVPPGTQFRQRTRVTVLEVAKPETEPQVFRVRRRVSVPA